MFQMNLGSVRDAEDLAEKLKAKGFGARSVSSFVKVDTIEGLKTLRLWVSAYRNSN